MLLQDRGRSLFASSPTSKNATGGRRSGTAAGPPDVDRGDSLDTRDSGLLSRAPQKNSLTAGQCFAIQFSEPSNGNIMDKRAT